MFRKTLKRSVSILTLLAMMLTLFPFAAFAEDTTASDLDGHWAEEVMQEWIGYGIIAGYEDGTVRPDRSITRAEMTALLDRVMDYQTTAANHFTDLDDNWYTDVVLKANAAGMISGYPDGTVRPNATISRQEAVAMFARVLSLDTANAPEADFTDMDAVGDWAKDAVNAMAAKGYVNGDNGQFRPQSGITRAEVITIFNNIFDDLYAESGTYFGDIDGSAVISADDVTLENTAIDGDLIVAEGVGDGHVVLDNVTIDGKLIIRGGGENSVIIRGNSSVGTVTVERIDGAVRVAVEDGASVDTLFVNDGSDTVTVEGTIGTLNVATGAAEVVLNGDTDTLNVSSENAVVTIAGTLGTVTVDEAASDATINIQSDATVSTLTTAATNTTVNVLGSVETVQVADTASDATIAVSENASVSSVTTTAQNTTVSGAGTVTNVEVGETASGTTVTTPGTTVENNSSDDVTIGDGETIGAGDTATTPGGTTEEPSEPSTPSEPSRPSHTHTYVDGVCTAGDAYDPTWAQVNSAETWNAAVAAGQNIVLTDNFTTDAQLTIDNTNSTSGSITVNGNGHIITATGEQPWENVNGEKHLVLITDAADNVTLKNITLDSANLAYGLQAYCVTDTVLDNVTLQNSVGAGLTVNGSIVTANSLTTTDNAWGGVNVDNGENVSGPTTFTFDATSTFNEGEGKAAVYSDAGNVTVNAPEGWAKVAAPTEQKPNQCVWQQLFAGGNGTEASPYLISTAEQLANIDKLSAQMENEQPYYFTLTTDIDYTTTTSYINTFCGVLDGDGHSIRMSDSSDGALIAETSGDVTIRDLTIVQTAQELAMLTVYANGDTDDEIIYENITFESDAPAGTQHVACSYGASQFGMQTSGKVTFRNCVNNVDYTIPGDTNTYGGIFIGNYIPQGVSSMISFIDCVNYGDINGNQVGFFFGNSAQASGGIQLVNDPNFVNTETNRAAIYVSGCRNEGTITATQKCEPFLSVNQTTVNDTANTALLADSSKFIPGTMTVSSLNDMGLQLTSDNKIQIDPSSNENVTNYIVRYTVSTGYRDAEGNSMGSWYFSVNETVAPEAVDSTTLDYITKVMLDTEYDATAADNQKYADLAKESGREKQDANGNEYIIVEIDGKKVAVIDSKQAASKYDEDVASMTCGSTPTYTLMAVNSSNQYIGSVVYQSANIPPLTNSED